MNHTRPIVLTIAGSDSGGGAGIQADLKTMTVHGCFGVSALTALTAQNTVGVRGILPVPFDFIQQQLDAIFEDFPVVAAKTGMLHSAEVIQLVAETLTAHPSVALVCDPVMVAKSGDKLLRDDAIEALKTELLPRATVVTPNIPEAEVLWGHTIRADRDKEAACEAMARLGARAVFLKGGHDAGEMCTDLLFDGERFHRFSSPRYPTPNTHGTGCTLSAAIASNLAKGMDVVSAVAEAKGFMDTAIRFSLAIGHGHGPTDHFAAAEREKERYAVLHALEKAVETFCSKPAGSLIPEIQTNLAYGLPFATSRDEVAAIPGRIVNLKGVPHASGCPAFGASRHVASIVLTVMQFFPDYRSVMDIRYDPAFLQRAEALGLVVRSFDRRNEPPEVKEREGSTLEWGTREVLSQADTVPDLIYDLGDVGKEPVIRVIGTDPMAVVTKALEIGGIRVDPKES